mmetsp:Transcript_4447/g.10311  ORF Transcript_4447/g.10311 Transcript_4447/m.10311 type:complete len:84 (-) Transcript_4447:1885-2136(-)
MPLLLAALLAEEQLLLMQQDLMMLQLPRNVLQLLRQRCVLPLQALKSRFERKVLALKGTRSRGRIVAALCSFQESFERGLQQL